MEIVDSPVTRLKNGTDALHQSLDHDSLLHRLMANDLTLIQYAEVLQRLHRCYCELESNLDAVQPVVGQPPAWLDARIYRRSADIAADLQALGHSPDPSFINDVPRMGQFVRTLPEAAGVMYVVAGASMGARVIHRTLSAHFGASAGHALQYYSGPKDASIPNWSTMRQRLDQALQAPDDEVFALNAAKKAFEVFIKLLRP
jgi:heme oxygenase